MNFTGIPLGLAALAALLLARTPKSTGDEKVEITKNKPSVIEKSLDLSNPPEEIRGQLGTHKGLTTFDYRFRRTITWEPKSHNSIGDEIEATILVTRVKATLDLTVTIYLPDSAVKKLRQHEDGHRKIAEAMYEQADSEAKRLALGKIGMTYTGKGATLEAAQEAAMKSVSGELRKEYLDAINEEGKKIHVIYDRLTTHGTNEAVKEDDAIRDAFAERKAQRDPAPTSQGSKK